MLFKVIIDTDNEKTGIQTLKVEFKNNIEFINRYTVTTTIINYDNSILFKKSEIMNHEKALKYIICLKNMESSNIVGLDTIVKQTLIKKDNPFISHDEYIKRFLWE